MKQREPLLTTKEFADYVRLHPSKITTRIRRGEIKAHNICQGRRKIYAIPESELDRFLAATRHKA